MKLNFEIYFLVTQYKFLVNQKIHIFTYFYIKSVFFGSLLKKNLTILRLLEINQLMSVYSLITDYRIGNW